MLKSIFRIGLKIDDSFELISLIEIANKLNFTLLILEVIYLVNSYFQNYPSIFSILFLAFLFFSLFLFFLNYARQFHLARFLLSIFPIILTGTFYCAVSQGTEDILAGNLFLVFTSCVIPFMVFSWKEKLNLLVSFSFCALYILALKPLNIWIDIPFENSVSKELGGFYFTITIALAALFSSLYALLSNFEKKYVEKDRIISELEFKIEESKLASLKLEETLVEVERAHEEEKRRKWASDGISQVAEILRTNEESNFIFEKLTSFVAKYLKINQTALFITEEFESRTVLKLKSTFAYDRKKYLEKSIEIGEGLVGQCYLEKEPIILKEVPDQYVHITSGLGQANASYVAIIPLKIEQKIEGILELASFKVLEDFEIDFLLKIGESISSMVSSMKINEKTRELYQQSQMYSEQMRAQEEEMRQNLEELMATQEEMVRKEGEMKSQSELLELIIDNIPFPVFIKDSSGKYTLVNKAEAEIFNTDKEEILGFDDSKFVADAAEMHRIKESDRKIVEENVAVHFPEQYLTLDNGVVKVFRTSKIPFLNKTTNQVNILGVSVDLSDIKNVERELQAEIANIKLKFNVD